MPENVLIKDDMVMFDPIFTPAVMTLLPSTLSASASNVKINGQSVCLAGDEEEVILAGCMYFAPPFIVPGEGELSISNLADCQLSQNVRCNSKALLLACDLFEAELQVNTPAQSPPSMVDLNLTYLGQGTFISTNYSVKAS